MALVAKQPTEIFICNTSNIDSMRHGRPQTVMLKEGNIPTALQGKLPNGPIVKLLTTQETQTTPELDHVHSVGTIGAIGAGGALGKFIIISPEIRVEQYRRIDNSIAGHMLVANETYTAYELGKLDRIEYSQAYCDDTLFTDGALNITVGATLDMNANGKLVAGGAFRVVSIREQSKPLMYAPHVQGKEAALMHAPVIMIKLEVVEA